MIFNRSSPITPVQVTTATLEQVIASSVSEVPDRIREQLRSLLESRLLEQTALGVKADEWRNCAGIQSTSSEYEDKLASYLRDLACGEEPRQQYITIGLAGSWIGDRSLEFLPNYGSPAEQWSRADGLTLYFAQRLARGLLGMDGRTCEAAKALKRNTKQILLGIAQAAL
jgi:hypothetical protein